MTETQISNSLISVLKSIFGHINRRRKYQFMFLIFLTFLGSFAEMLTLGAVIPFITVLTQPEIVLNNSYMSPIINFLEIRSEDELVIPMTLLFCSAAIFSAVLRMILLWVSIMVSNLTGADLSEKVYSKTLHQPYSVHVSRNSSEIISGITQKVTSATNVIASLVTVATSIILMSAILIALMLIDPFVASSAILAFGLAYGGIAFFTRLRLKENSRKIANTQTQVIKSLQEGLGGIRDVLLDGNQEIYTQEYRVNIRQQLIAIGQNQYITLAPRFVMESIGMIMIALLALFVFLFSSPTDSSLSIFPSLGALALAAQRLLPLLQQLYGNWSAVLGSQVALNEVLALLDQKIEEVERTEIFNTSDPFNSIKFCQVSFKHNSSNNFIFENLDFEIFKGDRIGIVGETGAGKSTLLDLIMGLLCPVSGNILINNKILDKNTCRSWQECIAHVPQNIFLKDGSIAENIAFGDKEIHDLEKINKSSQQACIDDFITENEHGIDLIVGERGVRLSGGQCQRIGLARAFYKNPKILILDEATSALDSDTETKVMHSIESRTSLFALIMIAHRVTSLKNCNRIFQVSDGNVSELGDYSTFKKNLKG